MKYLAIIRHGDYARGGRLSDKGRQQMAEIAEKLKPFSSGIRTQIITSTASRAVESAQIIGEILLVPVKKEEVLWSEKDHPEDFMTLLKLINVWQDEAVFLILVTHLEYTLSFPAYFASKEWKTEVPLLGIRKGEGVLLCQEDETYQLIKESVGVVFDGKA